MTVRGWPDARRLIGHPLASSTVVLSSLYLARPLVVEANPVTPRRAHPETDDKVHPATPAYTATVRCPHTHVHTHIERERETHVRVEKLI